MEKSQRAGKILISSLVVIQFIYIFTTINSYFESGMLLPPVGSFHAIDTFMDFFNTNYFIDFHGKYEDWKSIYPPLVFIIGNLITDKSCTLISPLYLRDCNLESIYIIFLFLMIGALQSSFVFCQTLSLSKGWKALAAFAFLFSMPSLFALERGNYIVICFAVLSLMSMIKSDKLQCILLALLLNIKQYMVILASSYLVRKKFRQFLYVILAGAVLFVITSWLLILDRPFYLLLNMIGFATDAEVSEFDRLWYPNSIFSYLKVVESNYGLNFFGGQWQNYIVSVFKIIKIGFIFGGMYLFWLLSRNSSKVNVNLINLAILLMLLVFVDNVNGYGYLLIVPFAAEFLLISPAIGLIGLLLILNPFDFGFWPCVWRVERSFLTEMNIVYQSCVTLFSYIRPMVLIIMLINIGVFLRNVRGKISVQI